MKKIIRKNSKSHSSLNMVMKALLFLVLAQAFILMCFITLTGSINKIKIASYDILTKQSLSRKNEIQSTMQNLAFALLKETEILNNRIEKELAAKNLNLDSLSDDTPESQYILSQTLLEMCNFTKQNSVTGLFVVFDTSEHPNDTTIEHRTSLYIRDSSPDEYHDKNTSLLLEYGSIPVARENAISVDYLWEKNMDFTEPTSKDFYFKPINAAITNKDLKGEKLEMQDLGYWSSPFFLKKDDLKIITYSLPLINSNGRVYGVLGLELQADYMAKLLPYSEIPIDMSAYSINVDKAGTLITDTAISSGPFSKQFLSGPSVKLDYSLHYNDEKNTIYKISNLNFPNQVVVGSSNEIKLYNKTSHFYNEKWFITCMAPLKAVETDSRNVTNAIALSILLTVSLATFLSLLVSHRILEPIQFLLHKIRNVNPEQPVRFEKTFVNEIDDLSKAFESLSDRVSNAASRMFQIVELVDMSLGSFEINYSQNKVRISKTMYKLMDLPITKINLCHLTLTQWEEFLSLLGKGVTHFCEDSISESTHIKTYQNGTERWLRIRQFHEDKHSYGVVMDVTEEIMQRQRLEFERNYDNLTKLLNRNAFNIKVEELIRTNPNKTGIMIFSDLDDLKFLNDTYGHEIGDIYIKRYADFLMLFKEIGAVVCRISGDEFAVYMHGFDNKEDAKNSFHKIFNDIHNVHIYITEDYSHKMRVSVGLSFYPDDTSDYLELIKYADFAMYEIKKSIKGDIREFDLHSYDKNAFVLNMRNILNFLIEERRIRYAFQPIVDVKTGEIFAYEALMRSMVREFTSPEQILKVAQAQSKLYQIEKLTFEIVLKWLEENIHALKDKKIFINSIPNQILSDIDRTQILDKYKHLLSNVVFEITENEFSSEGDIKTKATMLKQYGGSIAIDDFGSGYSNELILLTLDSNYLKIDMGIVRNIDKDTDRQQLVRNTIAYAASKNIKIIAEGVETYEEMQTLKQFGVDYIQGYYFCKPNFELEDIAKDFKKELF